MPETPEDSTLETLKSHHALGNLVDTNSLERLPRKGFWYKADVNPEFLNGGDGLILENQEISISYNGFGESTLIDVTEGYIHIGNFSVTSATGELLNAETPYNYGGMILENVMI